MDLKLWSLFNSNSYSVLEEPFFTAVSSIQMETLFFRIASGIQVRMLKCQPLCQLHGNWMTAFLANLKIGKPQITSAI